MKANKIIIDSIYLNSEGGKEILSHLIEYLQKRNHNIKYKDMTSGLNIIWKKNQLWQGIADPRREGFAIGYQRNKWELNIFLKIIFSIFIVIILKLVFPTLLKGLKRLIIVLIIAIVFFNIVLNNNLYL